MNHYGIKDNASKLLSSYLSDRKQYVQSEGILSDVLSVLCGVPQGSVLGPLLFILYINDMARCTELDTSLFADDAVLTYGCDSLKSLEKIVNKEVNKLHDWFIANKLIVDINIYGHISFTFCFFLVSAPQ